MERQPLLQKVCRLLALPPLVLIAITVTPTRVAAQAGLRESLERLDTNQDGMIDPDEITPLSRPYLERIAEARRLSLDRPNRIDQYQEAARIYYALQNGVAGERVRPEPKRSIRPFGLDDDEIMIPEFGLAEIKYPYTPDDLEEAEETLERYDRNNDGALDYRESRRVRWSHRDPFADDLDGDERLNRLELAQRYARRRMLSGQSGELIQRAKRVGNGIEPSVKSDSSRNDRDSWWRRGGTGFWLTATLMERFDKNRNGRLEREEAQELNMPTGQIDVDRDQQISREELLAYVTRMQDEHDARSGGLPAWFIERDINQDRQVTMPEYTETWTEELLAEFESLDANGDGLLTASEVGQSRSAVGGSYSNRTAVPLPPKETVISTIEIDDEFLIADVNVQLSITHSQVSQLDAFLVGPDETRIELFTAVGGRDDNFNQTKFDDTAREPINKARPPFEGTYIPEGLLKRQPGLHAFNGKPVTGTWQLVINGLRNERYGMLHEWNLEIVPAP